MARQAGVIPTVYTEAQTREQIREEMQDKGWWVSIPLTTFPVHWLYDGEQRLDARYYAHEAFAARRVIEDSELEVQRLEDTVQDIFVLGRFKRIYARDVSAGWPYLSATEALTFRPTSERWIARDHAPKNAERHFASEGWILLTCSGTVGRMVIANKRLEKFFLTHDLIRIVPSQSVPRGYLYAFLSSWVGQALIAKSEYGSAIKHLEPHHLAGVQVPLLPQAEQEAIHSEIVRAYALRDAANDLLDEAETQLHHDLGLRPFDPTQAHYMPPPPREAVDFPTPPPLRAFTTPASELNERLDASYHVPIAQAAVRQLRNGKYPLVSLAHLTDDTSIPPRFKRIYVGKAHGTPFLQPSHLPLMRPYDLGYLAETTEHLDALILTQGDVLVTTDGTVGRVAIVSSYLNGWAGSNNMARIRYGVSDQRNGYLAIFLTVPYGYYQLTREIYGGVVDHLEESHIEGVLIPEAPLNVQRAIGKRVVAAYEKKDEANVVENATVQYLERLLEERAKRGD
jgi:type I restriction enzyme S subunit